MLSCIKELGICQEKLFGAQFQKTHAQMTSFLAPLHGIVLGRNVAIKSLQILK